ncbi:CHAT domain-containing protein [Mycena vulgaris]|nr:CHAT domain-containing protein [Mycena vulgaris]
MAAQLSSSPVDTTVSNSNPMLNVSGIPEISGAIESPGENSQEMLPEDAGQRIKEAQALLQQYRESGNLKDLDAAFRAYQEAVGLFPEVHPDHSAILQNLATCFEYRYWKLGDVQDFQAAVQNYQKSRDLTPKGHPDRSGRLYCLAMCFGNHYRNFGDLEALDAACQNYQESVSITPEGDPNRAIRLQGLVASFIDRYQRTMDVQDLEVALKHTKEVLHITPEGHPAQADRQHRLGTCFEARYWRFREEQDLKAALQNYQTACSLTTEGDPDRAGRLQQLAACFGNLYQKSGDMQNLEAALRHFREALSVTPEGPDQAGRLQGLARCFEIRYQKYREGQDLKAALQNYQKLCNLTPEGHPDRAAHLHSLAKCFGSHYQTFGGGLEGLEDAIQYYQESLSLTPGNHPDRAGRLQGLAICFLDQFKKSKDAQDLHAACQNFQASLSLIPEDHPSRADILQGLATVYDARYRKSGSLVDLNNAVKNQKAATLLTSDDHPEKGYRLYSLAVSSGHQFHRFGDLNVINDVIQNFQTLVALEDDPYRHEYLLDLAVAFFTRYSRVGDPQDLEAALHKQQEAFQKIPKEHPIRPLCLQQMARSFLTRYERTGDPEDLHTAMQHHQEAVNLNPKDEGHKAQCLWGLATSFLYHYWGSGYVSDLMNAAENFQAALNLAPEDNYLKSECLKSSAKCYAERYRRFRKIDDLHSAQYYFSASFKIPTLNPESSWADALYWASIVKQYQRSYCLPAYNAAFNLLPEILWIGHSIPLRQNAIHRLNVAEATAAATRDCIKISSLTTAVEVMEQGLAIIFQQMLQLKTDVSGLPPDQTDMFQRLSSELYHGNAVDPLDTVDRRNQLLENIRKQPGLEYFLLPKPYKVLCHASQGGPVVILNSHKKYCDAIIILNPTSDPIHVPLRNVTLSQLKANQVKLKDLLGRCNARIRGQSASSRLFHQREMFTSTTSQEDFADMLTWLWCDVVGPIYQALKLRGIQNGRLWWLPTGGFTGLPLHASPPTNHFITSYTATLGSLLDAQSKQPSTTELKLGIVGVTHTGPDGANALDGVEQEVRNILSVVGKHRARCLEGQQATADSLKLQLRDCAWVHLACHGKQDLVNPTKSSLLLYESNLELETLLQMDLPNAQFVFLAACQTAMGDSALVNESFHLGGGFIAAGFRGAIGTMWTMDDGDGPLVAQSVYSHLFREGKQPQAIEAAEALHLAVKQLKARKVPYERWVPFIHMGV